MDPAHNSADLLAFRVHGMTPFLTHGDCVNDRLTEASALLTVLTAAFDVSDDANGPEQHNLVDGITNLRAGIYARAFEGVRTLIHLAHYHANLRGA